MPSTLPRASAPLNNRLVTSYVLTQSSKQVHETVSLLDHISLDTVINSMNSLEFAANILQETNKQDWSS